MKTKSIDCWPGYTINSKGEIFSKFKKLTPVMCKGYYRISLSHEGIQQSFSVHRLVAEIFLDNPEDKKRIKFKDGDKSNVKLSNLKWV